MLLAAPSGAYLKDELRVTDSGMMGLVMGALRVASGRFHLGLVIAWNQTSVLPLEAVMATRAEPFFIRPVGLNKAVADGLFASAVRERYGFAEEVIAARVHQRSIAARRNPRSVARAVPSVEDVTRSAYVAWPLRAQQQAPITDGAVALVLASQRWLNEHPDAIPRARVAGVAWAVDSYRLDRERLSGMAVLRDCFAAATSRAGWHVDERPDVVELEPLVIGGLGALGIVQRPLREPARGQRPRPFALRLIPPHVLRRRKSARRLAGGPVVERKRSRTAKQDDSS
jgi:hypothetical protein